MRLQTSKDEKVLISKRPGDKNYQTQAKPGAALQYQL